MATKKQVKIAVKELLTRAKETRKTIEKSRSDRSITDSVRESWEADAQAFEACAMLLNKKKDAVTEKKTSRAHDGGMYVPDEPAVECPHGVPFNRDGLHSVSCARCDDLCGPRREPQL